MRSTASYWPFTLSATGQNTLMIPSMDFRNAVWTVTASGNANCTIKFYASNQETRPDLTTAASTLNRYATNQVVLLESGNGVAWDTGIVYSGSQDGTTRVEMNDNLNKWIGVVMTARSAGTVTLYVDLADNG